MNCRLNWVGLRQLCRVFAVLCLLLLMANGPAAAALRIGGSPAAVTLPDISGIRIDIPGDIRGKVLILHFWQIGCSSCGLEMPAMDRLYRQYRQKGLEILSINVGQPAKDVRAFAPGLGVSYRLLIDEDKKSKTLYGVTDVPRTYIIDRQGIVRYRILGGASAELLKKLIFSLF